MKVAACLTHFPHDWSKLRTGLDRLSTVVIMSDSAEELVRSLGSIHADLYLVDAREPIAALRWLLNQAPADSTLILVIPQNSPTGDLVHTMADDARVYDELKLSDSDINQQRVIQRALEHTALLSGRTDSPPTVSQTAPPPVSSRITERPWEQAVRALSRSLSAGFELKDLYEPFLDLASDITGAVRIAILSVDAARTSFSVVSSRGLFGPMLKLYRHPGRSGLAEWLVKEGRPLRRDDPLAQTSTAYADICRSFDVLQASVCIPLAALGELLGILALGNGMKGEPPTDEQVEVLFGVCSHVAVAMQNIQMHQEMERQKLLNESVLQHMTNGVAAIDADGQITLFNRRAAEITGLASEMIVGRDLRLLPAPLADYLFEAMRTGKVSRNTNVSLPGSGLPIEASMYPLVLPGVANPVGSVLVVEDISERKTLDATRRHADRQDILARLVGQLAHELRNPLTAVKTFADLFPHERSDPEFLTFVERTVIPEIFRLDQIVGKLTDFVNHSSLEMTSCSLAAVLDDLVQRAAAEAGALMVKIRLLVEDDTQPVRADSNLLSKALWYLLLHLMQNAPRDEGAEITIRAFRETDPPNRVIVDLASNKPWVRDEELESVFDPLLVSQDQLNLALPVARKIIQEHRGDVEAISGKAGLVTLRVSMQAGDEAWQAPASLGFEEIGPPRKVVSLGYDFDE